MVDEKEFKEIFEELNSTEMSEFESLLLLYSSSNSKKEKIETYKKILPFIKRANLRKLYKNFDLDSQNE